MKQVLVAKFSHEGQMFVGKRSVEMYDADSEISDQLIKDANVGLTLREQASIRNAVKAKNGLGKVTTAGVSVDLSAIESV